jgi:very-short-patch-repair endonuclease
VPTQHLNQIAALSAAHHGVFSSTQWIACELTRRQLHLAVKRGVVEPMGPRSFRFAGHPVAWTQRAAAGLLDLGADAYVSGDVAARLLGLDGFNGAEQPTFIGPVRLRNRVTVGDVRSTQRALRPIDRVEIEGLRVLSASRLIIEECGRWSPKQLADAIDSACRLGWTNPDFLQRQLKQLRGAGKPGVRQIDRLLDDQRTESWLERTALKLIRASGLPQPTTQHRVAGGEGPVARVDLMWESSLLVVELAGHRFHSTRRQVQRDQQRHTELTLLGYRVLTFTYSDVAERPEWIIGSLRRALTIAA